MGCTKKIDVWTGFRSDCGELVDFTHCVGRPLRKATDTFRRGNEELHAEYEIVLTMRETRRIKSDVEDLKLQGVH